MTPLLLDVLRDGQTHATFFLVGEAAERHPDIVQRMVAEGHLVGSHSMRHPDFRTAAFGGVRRDVAESRRALARITGADVHLFRPPHGHLTFLTALLVRWKGYATWLWNVDSYDWKTDLFADDIVADVGAAPPGSVVLLHDTNVKTVDASRALIEHFSSRGIPLVTLPSGRK